MALKTFNEYLDSKGKTLESPKISDNGDEVDMPKGRDTKPPKGEGMSDDQKPYSSDGKSVSSKKEKGFGDEGDSDLKYDAQKEPKAAKIPTAEWNLATETRDAILANPRMLEHLVNEWNKANLLGPLVAELSNYRETFSHLTEIMANETYGPSVCNRFARAIQESVTPMRDNEEEMDDEQADFDGENEIPDDVQMNDEDPMDETPPSEEDLEPGMDGMPAKKPMPKALEHLNHSLQRNFI